MYFFWDAWKRHNVGHANLPLSQSVPKSRPKTCSLQKQTMLTNTLFNISCLEIMHLYFVSFF